ncbi:uncharacterized protein N7459_002287 [Penicillium hispanicum]|uniref:uncharacterized protein n=1 Tax=Penicillium hispanicum TaxID=1080232 RepID=UPI002542173A|nr:uncharacterized protein N7459_002287 [Penicillium hispanicum]KAJ5591918.1 hypothetical protein N7459_002287 [Penicillium hispanicum]
MEVHVVSKQDISQHATFTLPESPAPDKLAESSIRIRSQLIGLTSNNLSYAQLGSRLHWWDAYPVSQSYPAPYNDSSLWGIAPAWGFAAVEETTIPELPTGTLLYGFWPTSAALTDLKLKPGVPSGRWIEISEHRQQLMTLYNHYVVTPASFKITSIANPASPPPEIEDELDRLAWASILLVWRAGVHLSKAVFPPNPKLQPPVHPLGNKPGLPWTAEDGDLSSAAVVSLAASTKTAGSFSYFLHKRPKEQGPLSYLQVTSSVDNIAKAIANAKPAFASKVVDYNDIDDESTGAFLRDQGNSKIVIVDFGARPGILHRLLQMIKKHPEMQSLKVVIIQLGGEQKVYTPSEMLARMKEVADLGKVMYNTSALEDTLIESVGEEAFFSQIKKDEEEIIADRSVCFPGLKIVWGQGVSGTDGIEGGWTRLSRGEVTAAEGLVYRVPLPTTSS